MKPAYHREALEYHSRAPRGKIEVRPTKPTATQGDLSLAYTPGVAEPCREIHRDRELVYEFTAKGNLVAVISNGTAVLGLGNIGPHAAKPVMEGKGVLFKRFAGIDVFDLEIAERDPDKLVDIIASLEPSFGGINLEDISAPSCFEIERRLRERMSIPVFHDDQHGTAIIAGAALINALDLVGKRIDSVRVVFSGAGAAAIGCIDLWLRLGLRAENITLCDSKGVVHRGRTNLEPHKQPYAADTDARSLAEAMRGADVFVGLSVAGAVSADMVRGMAERPIVFALANPDPEITWDETKAARPDAIIATGRSDFPNQVNNVLGFPFIFRGALDVRARDINEEMKLAACRALAELAREDVPDGVLKAYGLERLAFGPEYLIPKPFDYRVLLRVPPAVGRAAMETGVARRPIADYGDYHRSLERLVSRRLEVMRGVMERARRAPKRVVFPEGEHDKILRAARVLVDEGIAHPILLARSDRVLAKLEALGLGKNDVTVIHAAESSDLEEYARRLHNRRWRHGVTFEDALKLARDRNYYATLMVEAGDADGLISGLTHDYPETSRPALQLIGTAPKVSRVSGAYMLVLQDRLLFLADTTVAIDPTAEEVAEIAVLTAAFARRFQVEPRVALLSFSNFGSNRHPSALKMRRAVELVREREPALEVDGEMQADTAVFESILRESYPWSRLKSAANVLIFPELNSANIAYKLIWRLTEAEAIGPVLLGMRKPVHVLQRGVEVTDVVNMTALCVVDAQEGEGRGIVRAGATAAG